LPEKENSCSTGRQAGTQRSQVRFPSSGVWSTLKKPTLSKEKKHPPSISQCEHISHAKP